MNTELNEAWTDEPPTISTGEKLLTYSQRVATMVNRAIQKCGDDSDAIAIAAFVAVSKGISRPTLQDLEDILFEITDEDFDAVVSYLSRVIDRRARAAVEVADEPGK